MSCKKVNSLEIFIRLAQCVRGVDAKTCSPAELDKTDQQWNLFADRALQQCVDHLRKGNTLLIKRDMQKNPAEITITFL